MYEIEDGKPIPPLAGPGHANGGRRKGDRNRYPFSRMAVGQSFFVPLSDAKVESLASAMSKAAERIGYRFTQRIVKGQGWRVWRIE